MISEATTMSKPDSRGTPSPGPPRPMTMLRKARSLVSRTRRQVTRRGLESLVRVGALDAFGERAHLHDALDRMLAVSQRAAEARAVGQTSLFEMEAFEAPAMGILQTVPPPRNPATRRTSLGLALRLGGLGLGAIHRGFSGGPADGASAWLVVQKHLGSDSLAAWLTGEGWAVRRLGSRKGYRILQVGRP